MDGLLTEQTSLLNGRFHTDIKRRAELFGLAFHCQREAGIENK